MKKLPDVELEELIAYRLGSEVEVADKEMEKQKEELIKNDDTRNSWFHYVSPVILPSELKITHEKLWRGYYSDEDFF